MNHNWAGGQRKRHCMVVHSYYPLREPRVEREAEALAANGYEVDVICLRQAEEPPLERYGSIRVHRLPLKRDRASIAKQFVNYLHFFALAAAKVTLLDRRDPYDTIQIHNLPDFLAFCALIPKLRGRSIILDLHDLMPEFYASRFGQGRRSFLVELLRWQERLVCRFANHVITVTDLWKETLIRRGVPPEKVSVVMNVADARVFNRARRSEPARTRDSVHLFYHGVVAPRAGLDIVLEAIARLREELPGLRFTIHGERGEHSAELAELAERLHIADRVAFSRDALPLSELPALIGAADFCVVPYRSDVFTNDILPTKLMEYVALGMPTIAARTRAIERYFDGTMVEFFAPGDVEGLVAAIRRLAFDPERCRELVRSSDEFNRRYSWSKLRASYVALVEGLGAGRATTDAKDATVVARAGAKEADKGPIGEAVRVMPSHPDE